MSKFKIDVLKIKAWGRKQPLFFFFALAVLFLSSSITISQGVNQFIKYYESTFGYNKMLYGKLEKLSTEVQIEHFNLLLGPPILKTTHEKLIEYVYFHKRFIVQALTDKQNSVVFYAVTTREENFNPSLTFSFWKDRTEKIVLGKTKFSEMQEKPERVLGNVASQFVDYHEVYYYGSPRNYKSYAFAWNEAGAGKCGEINLEGYAWKSNSSKKMSDQLLKFREDTVINTYGVAAPFFDLDNVTSIGPFWNDIKNILEKF